MTFDGSGNFSRLYNWTTDRDGGIRILASRMDSEFNNFASGMNLVFFRNGLVPMSGNLAMGQNSITGVAAGSVGAPSVRFADDPNTGVFLNGIGNYCVVAGGTTRLALSSTGADVTGDVRALNYLVTGVQGTSGLQTSSRIEYYGAAGVGYQNAVVVRQAGALSAVFSNTGLGLAIPLAVTSGGTGGTTQATARTGLGLGTASLNNTGDFQPALGFTPLNKSGDSSVGYFTYTATGQTTTYEPGLGNSSFVAWNRNAVAHGVIGVGTNTPITGMGVGNLGIRGENALYMSGSGGAADAILKSGRLGVAADPNNTVSLHVGGTNTIRTGGSGAADWAHFGYNGDAYVYGPAGVPIRFYTNAASNAVLDTSGNFTANGNITALSDKRFKSSIRELTNSLEAVNLMRPVRYTDNRNGADRIGFIAQDMQQIRPQYVLTDEKGYLSLAYGNVSADLVGAVQSLSRTVDKLLARIEVLEAR